MAALEMQKSSHEFQKTSLAQHILLIDGNLQQRPIFSELLKSKLRYRLTEVCSATEAEACAKGSAAEFDLVLLDLSTVDQPFECLKNLKGIMPEIPVIVFVQYGDYQSAAEALVVGAQDFLTKPVAEARMHATLRNCIQLRNAKREADRAMITHSINGMAPHSLHGTETIISLLNPNGDAKKIEEIERVAIRFAIRFYNGRMTEVARKLGIGRSTLYRKLEAIGEI